MSRIALGRSDYPVTHRTDQVDELHGRSVPDPYRWLENVDAEGTTAWTAAQQRLTQSVLGKIPYRGRMRDLLERLARFEVSGLPREAGSRLFFTHQAADARQPSLYWQSLETDEMRCLIRPEELSEDATVSIAGFAPSPSGRYVAYGLAEAGSDWQRWRILDVATGTHLPDQLEWLKFPAPSWLSDDSGFFYAGSAPPPPGEVYKAPVTRRSLRFHKVRTPQDEDRTVFEHPDKPTWICHGQVTPDDRYLVITVHEGTRRENRVSLLDLRSDDLRPFHLVPTFDAACIYLGQSGRELCFLTTHTAPLGRIVSIDPDKPDPSSWRELIPESEGVIRSAAYISDRLIVASLRDALGCVSIYEAASDPGPWSLVRKVDLPGRGTVEAIEGTPRGRTAYYVYQDYACPETVFCHDLISADTRPLRPITFPFDPAAYVTERVGVMGMDGTEIPVFITHKRDTVISKETPTLLFGYGGFNISLAPHFRIENLAWMEMGGQLAVACIRGGGEYGRAWHEAGCGKNRRHVFSDFIAAAEWLIAEKRTSTPKLAIYGRSNGGLLVGAAMTKRPELFGACLPTVGVLDMLRFHKFTVGAFWVSDYGSPDDPEMFPVLYGYSPLHNVRAAAYPPTLITTGDHDDRVFPAHSFKFAAALQAAQQSGDPILLRVDTRAGHGLGKPKTKLLDEIADRWAFAFAALGTEPRL